MSSNDSRDQLERCLEEANATTGRAREEALGRALLVASKLAFARALACVEDWLDGTRDDAEDALQAVRLRACRRLKHFVVKSGKSFMSWFLDILDHYLIDEQRRREAKGGHSKQAGSDPVAQSVLDLIETREPGPALEAQRAEDVEAVRRALRRLSIADREMVLAFKDGVSIDQIAFTTGRTYKQTRLDIDKLLARLRAELRAAAR